MRTTFGNVSTKGEITIPMEIRRQPGIKPGDTLRITVEDNKIVLRQEDLSILGGYGSIPALERPLTDDEIDDIVEQAIVEDFLIKDRRSRPTHHA